MIYIIIIAIIGTIFYLSFKGRADLKNVIKAGGLKNKYKIFINRIISRNSFYQLNEINPNNLELLNTGMKFKLIEIDKKLQITWFWNSFSSGKTHKLLWKFDENENQDKIYETVDRDIAIQNFIDDGMTKPQAEDWFKIGRSENEEEQEKLVNDFSAKYPELWSKITG